MKNSSDEPMWTLTGHKHLILAVFAFVLALVQTCQAQTERTEHEHPPAHHEHM